MTPTGHIGASYLLANSSRLFGETLSPKQEAMIVLAGTGPDIDLLLPLLTQERYSHHDIATHTPFFLLTLWFVFYYTYGKQKFSPLFNLLLLLAPLLHLVLDELATWLYQLKLQPFNSPPQINWFFPLTDFAPKTSPVLTSLTHFTSVYFHQAPINIALELTFISLSLLIIIRKRLHAKALRLGSRR